VSDVVRLGVVGAGALTQRAILPHLTQENVHDSVQVRAVCDPVAERAEEVAARFGVPRVYDRVEDLVSAGEADAVTIASPIGLHFEHGRLALEAGLHVHFNKTMCTTVDEADVLINTAQARGLKIVASPGEGLRPQLRRTRQLIEQGAIGKLSWAVCGAAFGRYHESEEPERLQPRAGGPIDPSWYFRKPGGGPMYDMAAYALHGLTSVLGPARQVTALSGKVLPRREFMGRTVPVEVDDNSIVLLEIGDSALAVVYGTAAGTILEDFGAACYFGTEGEIRGLLLNGEPFDFPGRELTLDAPTWDWEAQMRVLPHVVGPHRRIPESHVFEDIMQLVDGIRQGTWTPVTAEQARHVIDIIESAYRAAETGVRQEIRTVFPLPAIGL
jgi:predicted dehydrogenase